MATFNLVLDTRVKRKKNLYNLCIRVNIGSLQFYLNLAKMTLEDYHKVFIRKVTNEKSVEFREKIYSLLAKSEKIYLELKPFSVKEYRKRFYEEEEEVSDSLLLSNLLDRFLSKTNNLKPRTIQHIRYSGSVLETNHPNLNLLEVTPCFIEQFVRARLDAGVTRSSINSTLRDLRRIVNYFINEDPLLPSSYKYPFGRGGYSIQNYFPRKLVMSNEEIKRVIDLKEFDSPNQEYARDIWVMLYRCNGINFVDLLRMRWDNIKGDYLMFFRKKTETTRKNNIKEIIVPLTPELRRLMGKIGVKESPFILGKLEEGYSDLYLENKNHRWKKILNKELKEISDRLNLSVPLRLKSARDSYATTLRRAKVSKDDIGEMLGHSNSVVTEHYLASIDMETTFDINRHLL